jgi:galactokinase
VHTRFVALFGGEPEAGWAAPGRVNLIGEHTDYNDGFVLPCALGLRTAVAAARRPGRQVSLRSVQRPHESAEVDLDHLRPGLVPPWAAYAAGVLWALADAGHRLGGAALLVDGNVPIGAGLASSAALECAVAATVNDLFGLGIPARRLVGVCVQAENEFVGVPCGVMDQLAAFECRAGAALWVDTRSLETEQVALPLEAAGLCLLLIDTGLHHQLAASQYAERRHQCERAARLLGVPSLRDARLADLRRLDGPLKARARHVLTENKRVSRAVTLLRSGRVADLGPLFDASHRSLRDDFEVSSPELDLAVTVAGAAGALGARMTGAGFGGCAVALVPADRCGEVGRAVRSAFARAGFGPPSSYPAVPSAGAHPLARSPRFEV